MVACPNCQTPNRETARFCRGCGLWLLPRCPFCRAEILVPSAYCDQCGRALNKEAGEAPSSGRMVPVTAPQLPAGRTIEPAAQAKARTETPLEAYIPAAMHAKLHTAREQRSMEGQRRVVTMVFCDVQGSTEAASRLDPEEWAGIINGAFECMIPPVYHYEGMVARLMGDGILAFFGAPVTHEDDPRRAVLAGLKVLEKMADYKEEMFAEWGLELDARVGINTGLVVVGAVGSDLQVEYTALGNAINIAARMEQTAIPGTVQISEETYRHVAGLFDFEDLGFIQVKGAAKPIHTYRPVRARAAPERLRGIEGMESPTVGRTDEIATLQSALENLAEHGVGALIFLTGEAGVGKSRLIRETRALPQASGLTFHEIAPLSFEAAQPFAFFIGFVRQLAGIGEMDSGTEIRQKLDALAEQLPVELRGVLAVAFAQVMGLSGAGESPPEGKAFRRQLFASAREAVRVRFASSPGVVILDDLHWADSASLEIFSHLFALVDSTPILFLCASRPERDTLVWRVKNSLAEEYPHRFVEIPVHPLSQENSHKLVEHLLAVAANPPHVRELILEKSEGNPFFLEEIVRALIEDGVLVRNEDSTGWQAAVEVDEIEIPDSLQTLLAARLDRLKEETRQVVQMAAVIGRKFYYRVLQNIVDALVDVDGSLAALQRINLVVETTRLPELEYAFRHALLQETAYRSILRKQRREFHSRVGEAIEALFPSHLDEYAPVLAWHFDRAEDDVRALKYYHRAGDTSYSLQAIKESSDYYSRALAIIREYGPARLHLAPDVLHHLCLRLGRALELDGRYDEALDHYAEVEDYARSHGDRKLELAATAAHATIHSAPTDKFNRDLAETLSRQALALAQEQGDHETEAKIYWNLMIMSSFSGEPGKSFEYGRSSLEIARRYNLQEQLAYTLNDFQRATMMKGNVDEARALIEEAQQLWLALDNKAMYIDSLVSGSLIHMIQRRLETAEQDCLEALRLSQEIGNLWGQSYSYYTLGYLYTNQGKFSRALEIMEQAVQLAEPSGFAMPLLDSNAISGLVYGYLGDYERGRLLAGEALDFAKEHLPALQAGPLSILAILDYWQGDIEAMDARLGDSDPAPEINSFSGFERFVAECYRRFALGQFERLIGLTEKILPRVEPFGDIVYLADVLRITGEACLALGRVEEARTFLERAQAHSTASPHRKIDNLLALSRLETGEGHAELAEAFLVEAHQNVQIILKNIGDPGLEASYLARPAIKAVFEDDG